MNSNKILKNTLLISAILHIAIILPSSFLKSPNPKKELLPLEITYVDFTEMPTQKTPPVPQYIEQKREEAKPKDTKIESFPVEPEITKTQALKEHPEIEIPSELSKDKEPIYLDYYQQAIRAEIIKFARKNYPRFIAYGEICLHFVVSSRGQLQELRIVESRSTQNRLLRAVAKKSVLDAAPFAPFPEDLTQSQLPFNVIISFQTEN